jgi:hypothetical protein
MASTKYYLETSVAQDTKIEVDLLEFTRFLHCVQRNARGEAWLRQRHRFLKRRAESVNTDEVYSGFLRGEWKTGFCVLVLSLSSAMLRVLVKSI